MDERAICPGDGGGAGIGRATAMALARAGWHVALAGRRREPLLEVAREIGLFGRRAIAAACDVGDPEAVKGLFATIEQGFGRLDLLFNNAGPGAPAVPHRRTDLRAMEGGGRRQSQRRLSLHARRLRPDEARRTPRGGRIINNGSISAHAPRPILRSLYGDETCDHRAYQMIALDGRAHDIACGQIDIGNALTDMARKHDPWACRRPTGASRSSRRWTSRKSPRPSFTWRACRSRPTSCP